MALALTAANDAERESTSRTLTATTVLVGFFVSKNMDSLEDAMYEALEEKTEAEVELS